MIGDAVSCHSPIFITFDEIAGSFSQSHTGGTSLWKMRLAHDAENIGGGATALRPESDSLSIIIEL
jgi:hypothetical protein